MPSISDRPAKRKPTDHRWKRVPAAQTGFFIENPPGNTEDLIWCPDCRQHKPLSNFRLNSLSYCHECRAQRERERALRTVEERRDYFLRRNYGITATQYDAMLAQQGGVCAVCGQAETAFDPRNQRTRWLAVDHDHQTGQVRALLCSRCNQALGHLQEDPALIRALLAYAERAQAQKAA